VVPWAAQVVVALILAKTLCFKFTYAPETQVIFAARADGRRQPLSGWSSCSA
jgi:hypothetical protein